MKMLNPNILDEGNQMEILEDNDYDLDIVVRCNNCGKPTKYGDIRMISGFVGCDNIINVDGKEIECMEDLMNRVIYYKSNYGTPLYEKYRSGKVYRWRDGDTTNGKI